MDLLQTQVTPADTAAFVGCGPGLEIALLKSKFQVVEAYDIALNPRLTALQPDVGFREELFPSPRSLDRYDAIFMIELLEHLANPYTLIEACHSKLAPAGHLYLTTATNIPQFDHLYNFPDDHSEFEQRMQSLGFDIAHVSVLPHAYMTIDVQAKNHLYKLSRV